MALSERDRIAAEELRARLDAALGPDDRKRTPVEIRTKPINRGMWWFKPIAVLAANLQLGPASCTQQHHPSPALPNRHDRRMFAKRGTPIARADRGKLMALAEEVNAATREPGRQGVLKQTGIAVLRALLFRRWNHYTGQCNPSYLTIANDAGVSVRSVARAILRLREAGLLHWLASFVAGKRSSNRYRIGTACQNGAESTGQRNIMDVENANHPSRSFVDHIQHAAVSLKLDLSLLSAYRIAKT